MEVVKVNSIQATRPAQQRKVTGMTHQISFGAKPSGGSSDLTKKAWLMLRRLADQMKDITEIKNAFIAAIGTGIIAPIAILGSPGKGDKDDKDKKFLQALRQPLSAGLALGFQVPATIFINRSIDKLGYEKHVKVFEDPYLGELIPTEKYIMKGIEGEELKIWEANFEKVKDGKSLKSELEGKIRDEYKNVGLEVSDEKLAKEVEKEKKDFLLKKIAKAKHEKLKNDKLEDVLAHPEKYKKLADIKDIDLVNEDFQNQAEQRFKKQYQQLEKDANLSIFDRIIRAMGFETKKTKALDKAEKAFKKEKGLEILREENPEIFENKKLRLKSYIEAHQKDAEKLFGNKKFWISLLVNLFMVTASCYALNWVHPRVNKMIEEKQAEKKEAANLKVEVA